VIARERRDPHKRREGLMRLLRRQQQSKTSYPLGSNFPISPHIGLVWPLPFLARSRSCRSGGCRMSVLSLLLCARDA